MADTHSESSTEMEITPEVEEMQRQARRNRLILIVALAVVLAAGVVVYVS